MAEYKIRVKVGPNEFDAEGPKDFVEDLFQRFEALVNNKAPMLSAGQPKSDPPRTSPAEAVVESPLAKVFQREDKRIALIGRFEGEDRELDAALLILLGHKELRGVDAVSADELLYGLKQTGYAIERADRLMKPGQAKGLLTFSGIRRGTRYRLTIPGMARAKELGKELLDMFQITP